VTRRKKHARRTPLQVFQDLKAAGWVRINNYQTLAWVAELRLPVVNVYDELAGKTGVRNGAYTPGWVAHFYPRKTFALQARKNSKMIQAANAAIKLGSLAGKEGFTQP
jgi:hypothetical protein